MRMAATALMFTAMIAVGCAFSPMPSSVIDLWKAHVPGTPSNIHTEDELKTYDQFIGPLMYGGMGNTLSVLAVGHIVAKDAGVPCLVGWWDQKDIGGPYKYFHGRGYDIPGITLKEIFPNFLYIDFEPEIRRVLASENCYSDYSLSFDGLPDGKKMLAENKHWVAGYYFNAQCSLFHFALIFDVSFDLRVDWHPHRLYLVHEVFRFHPASVNYIETKYAQYLYGNLSTVSVHTRYGGPTEPRQDIVHNRHT